MNNINKSAYDPWTNNKINEKNAALSTQNFTNQSFQQQYQQNKAFPNSFESRNFHKKPFNANQPIQIKKFPYKANEPQTAKQALNKFDNQAKVFQANKANESIYKNYDYGAAAPKFPIKNRNYIKNNNNFNLIRNGSEIKMEIGNNGFAVQETVFPKPPQALSIWEMRKQIYSQKLEQEEYEREMQMSEVNNSEAFNFQQQSNLKFFCFFIYFFSLLCLK